MVEGAAFVTTTPPARIEVAPFCDNAMFLGPSDTVDGTGTLRTALVGPPATVGAYVTVPIVIPVPDNEKVVPEATPAPATVKFACPPTPTRGANVAGYVRLRLELANTSISVTLETLPTVTVRVFAVL